MPQGPIRLAEGTKVPFLPEYCVGFKITNNLTGEKVKVMDFDSGHEGHHGSLDMPPSITVEIETPNAEYAEQTEAFAAVDAVSNQVREAFSLEQVTTVATRHIKKKKTLTVQEFTDLIAGIVAVNAANPVPEKVGADKRGDGLTLVLNALLERAGHRDDRSLSDRLQELVDLGRPAVTATGEAPLGVRVLETGKNN
ncbi:MAG: hypothetical protein WCT36_05770 [Candidatus Gracilibacteria bacterium]